jgi:hypothetical protein
VPDRKIEREHEKTKKKTKLLAMNFLFCRRGTEKKEKLNVEEIFFNNGFS